MYLGIDVTYLSIHERILRAIFDEWGHGSRSRGYSPGFAVIWGGGGQGNDVNILPLNIQYALMSSLHVNIHYINILHMNIQYALMSSVQYVLMPFFYMNIHYVNILHVNIAV